MEARELRIGNWIYDCINEKNVIINGFHSTTIWLLNNNNNNQYQVACSIPKPIPLTEDILLKCGFENERLQATEYSTIRVDRYMEVILEIYSDADYSMKHIKHLHQLQNLYFALAGEELNIEL